MLPEKIKTSVRYVGEDIGVIEVTGEVTGFAENALMDSYRQIIDRGCSKIIMNFKNMEYMNSSGIGLLVTLMIRASRSDHQLAAVELRSHFRRVFGLTRLQEVMPVYDSEQEAVEALRAQAE
jgi:anti-sigma B factor antagonist